MYQSFLGKWIFVLPDNHHGSSPGALHTLKSLKNIFATTNNTLDGLCAWRRRKKMVTKSGANTKFLVNFSCVRGWPKGENL